jgi:hypothetical protein
MRAGRTAALILACLSLFLVGCALLPAGEARTPAPTPRPTVFVVTASGPFFETFDEPGDWTTGTTTASSGLVENGVYHLLITEHSHLAWASQTRSFGEGVYEVDATFINGSEGSSFGLIFLATSDVRSFIYAMITGDGRYDVGYCEDACNEQESLIGGYTLAFTILPDNQTNRLRVEFQDGVITFKVNGAPVSQLRGVERSEGLVGLIGESATYGGLEAVFDNLSVTEYPGE